MTHPTPRTFCTGVRVRLPRGWSSVEHRMRAFTLVEALVVLAILILIGGLALPGLTTWSSKYSESAFESKLQTAIDSARAIALSNSSAVKIRIEKSSGKSDRLVAAWHSSRHREDPVTDRMKSLNELDEAFSIVIQDLGSSKSASDSQLTLWTVLPDGSMTGKSGVTVRRGDGATAPVAVSMWSGKVKLGAFVTENRPWFESDDAAESQRPSDDVGETSKRVPQEDSKE